MRAIAANRTKALPTGAVLDCVDNSGAKQVEIIAVPRGGSHHARQPAGSVGDFLVVSVKKGNPEMRRQVINAVIVRQRRPYRRPDGTMVQFEDNAAVIVNPNGDTKGSDIKGPVAREAAERWPRIAATASQIV
jgi:large subunit ribosomal protein L14